MVVLFLKTPCLGAVDPVLGETDVWQVALYIGMFLVAALMGGGAVKLLDRLRHRDAERDACQIIERAEIEAASIRKEAAVEGKEKALQLKADLEEENARTRAELHERERRIDKLEDSLQQQVDEPRENATRWWRTPSVGSRRRSRTPTADRRSWTTCWTWNARPCHQLSGLGPEEAEAKLLERLEKQLVHEQGALIMKFEKNASEKCDAMAREMLITSLQRFAASHTAESTTSTVDIPNDDMKGPGHRARGPQHPRHRAGDRRRRDHRRHARRGDRQRLRPGAAERSPGSRSPQLIADGRIHPSRIEEIVAETEKKVEAEIRKHGEEAMQEARVFGLHDKVINLLGRLWYRTSYSQNVLGGTRSRWRSWRG